MANTRYGYSTPKNVAGGLSDLSPHIIVSRSADEDMKIGMGMMQGSIPGTRVKNPVKTDTADTFEGILMNGGLTPVYDDGKVTVRKNATVNILQKGRIYVRCTEDAEPAYGKDVYLVTDGKEAGMCTEEALREKAEGEETDPPSRIKLPARFLGKKEYGIAEIELS